MLVHETEDMADIKFPVWLRSTPNELGEDLSSSKLHSICRQLNSSDLSPEPSTK